MLTQPVLLMLTVNAQVAGLHVKAVPRPISLCSPLQVPFWATSAEQAFWKILSAMLESLKAANDSKSMTLSSPAMVTSSDLSYVFH